jgi:hypothetical protein
MSLSTLVPVSSSWDVQPGDVRQVRTDGSPMWRNRKEKRGRRCLTCGEPGHIRKTCGLTPEERAARRGDKAR